MLSAMICLSMSADLRESVSDFGKGCDRSPRIALKGDSNVGRSVDWNFVLNLSVPESTIAVFLGTWSTA